MPIASILTVQKASAVAAAAAFAATLLIAPERSLAAGKAVESTRVVAAALTQPTVNLGLMYAPDDASSVISVRFETLADDAAFDELKQRSPWLAAVVERVERDSCGALSDVARVTLCGRADEQPVAAIEFRTPVSLEQRAAARLSSEPYRRETIGEVQFFAPEGRAAAWRTAYAQANETTILAGSPRLLADVLARRAPAALSPAMNEVVERLDYSQPIAAAFDLHNASQGAEAVAGQTCFGLPRAALQPIGAVGVGCALKGQAMVALRLVCNDQAAAVDVQQSLRFGWALARTSSLVIDSAQLAEDVAADLDDASVLVRWSLPRERFLRLIGEPNRRADDEITEEL